MKDVVVRGSQLCAGIVPAKHEKALPAAIRRRSYLPGSLNRPRTTASSVTISPLIVMLRPPGYARLAELDGINSGSK